LTADYARLSGLLLKYAVHFSNLQEIVGESVVAGLLGEGRLRRLCWTNADLSDLEIVIHRKLLKTYEVNSPPASTLLSPETIYGCFIHDEPFWVSFFGLHIRTTPRKSSEFMPA
jgi:hypothetical protein